MEFRIVTVGRSKRLKIWEHVESGMKVENMSRGFESGITAVGMINDETLVLAQKELICLADTTTTPVHIFSEMRKHKEKCWTHELHVQKSRGVFFSASDDNSMKMWRMKQKNYFLCEAHFPMEDNVRSMATLSNPIQIACATDSGTIHIHDTEKHKALKSGWAIHDNGIYCIDCDSRSDVLYSCCKQGGVQVHDLNTYQKTHHIGSTIGIPFRTLVLLQNGTQLVTGGETRVRGMYCELHLYDTRKSGKVVTRWNAHRDSICQIFEEGQYLISCSRSGTAKVWKSSKQCARIQDSASIYGICTLSDGSFGEYQVTEASDELDRRLFAYGQSKFGVVMKNQTVKVWKPLLFAWNPKIELEKVKDLDVCLDQTVLLDILTFRADLKIESGKICEYFEFFRRLEMRDHMWLVLNQLEKLDLEDLVTIFSVWVMDHEPSVKNILYCDEEKEKNEKREEIVLVSALGFVTVAGRCIFNELVRRKEDVLLKSKEKVKVISSRLVQEIEVQSYDSELMKRIDVLTKKNEMWKMLYQSMECANVELRTKDGKNVKTHLEVLVLHSNFFYKMMKFSGSEVELFKETGRIQLEFLTEEELLLILRYYYLKEVTDKRIRNLISVFLHASKFFEGNLCDAVRKQMLKVLRARKATSREDVIQALSDLGHLDLLRNKHFMKYVLPVLRICGLSEETIKSEAKEAKILRNFVLMTEKMDALEEKLEKSVGMVLNRISGLEKRVTQLEKNKTES